MQKSNEKKLNYSFNMDPRLATRILINEKILEIIHTVLLALQQTNTHKYNMLIKMSKNEKVLKDILQSAKTEQYVQYLKGLQLITRYVTTKKNTNDLIKTKFNITVVKHFC